ncbi:MAG: hypothetical protein UE295_05520 [Acutalibacteraceae bacterium]|nr:hypothetical protein [Acutalibacteraceae bacterium]
MPFSAFATEQATESNTELTQQTLVDEVTNIKVTGMLPQGAQLCTVMELVDAESISDRFDPLRIIQDFPVDDYVNILNQRTYNKAENVQEYDPANMTFDVWTIKRCNGWAMPVVCVKVGFVKDGAVLDVDSELTVTIPFDFREALTKCGHDSNATAFEFEVLDNEKEILNEIEVIAKDKTEKGTFQYKINGDGVFFLGNDYMMKQYTSFYMYKPYQIFEAVVAERVSQATPPAEIDTLLYNIKYSIPYDICVKIGVGLAIALVVIAVVVIILLVKKFKKGIIKNR